MPTIPIIALIGVFAFIFMGAVFYASIYKRCPSDKILVIFGKGMGQDEAGQGLSAKCVHGGGKMVWPVFQNYGWLDLTPITIDIDLTDALSAENIRVSTPSTYTVGISTEPGIMQNAAERLLGESLNDIRNLARDIIFGQMRVAIATMKIEEINADRDRFIENISKGLEPELEKVGLRLINVNIKDVNDKSGYIDALGREAAAQAINEAKKKVAEQERNGEIGKAQAEREQRIQVAQADAEAVEGENKSEVQIAESDSKRRQKEAEAERKALAAEKVSEAKAKEEAYKAEKEAEKVRAERETATQRADTVVPAEIEKERIEILAEADAEEERRNRQGEADGIRAVMEARAEGLLAQLRNKGQGFQSIVQACQNDPQLATTMMIAEQLPDLVSEQVNAISDIDFDSVTVWENGGGENGKTSTANFLSGLVGSLPPLHELTENAGIDLPNYLGSLQGNGSGVSADEIEAMGEALEKKADRRKQVEDRVRSLVQKNASHLSDFSPSEGDEFTSDELDRTVSTIIDRAKKLGDASSEWHLKREGEVQGPETLENLRGDLEQNPGTYVSTTGEAPWIPYKLLRHTRKMLEQAGSSSEQAGESSDG